MDVLIESWVVEYVFEKNRGLCINRNPCRGITLEDRDVSEVDQRMVSLIELARS